MHLNFIFLSQVWKTYDKKKEAMYPQPYQFLINLRYRRKAKKSEEIKQFCPVNWFHMFQFKKNMAVNDRG